MLRVKRSVQAQYNTQVNFMSTQMLAAASGFTTDVTPTGVCVCVCCVLRCVWVDVHMRVFCGCVISCGHCAKYCNIGKYTELGAGVDEMALLEEKAKKIAEEAKKDQPKPKATMTFVK